MDAVSDVPDEMFKFLIKKNGSLKSAVSGAKAIAYSVPTCLYSVVDIAELKTTVGNHDEKSFALNERIQTCHDCKKAPPSVRARQCSFAILRTRLYFEGYKQ